MMPDKLKDKIILGMDPGTSVMGYGLIHIRGQNVSVIQYGVIHLNKYKDHALKLNKIFQRVIQLIEDYLPDEMAIEAPFFGKNVQSMLKLGRAQGVAIAAAISRDIPVVEYAPKKIKVAVTGNGNASKEQVASMLGRMFKIKEIPRLLDATDALGVALCHHYQNGKINTGKESWEKFIKKNSHRIIR